MAASQTCLALASASRSLAAPVGLQAREAGGRLQLLAWPAGASQAVGRTSRQYLVLNHGPLVALAVSTRRWLTGW